MIFKRLLLSVVAGLLLAGTATTQAQAVDGFRFWGYYQWTESSKQWTFAQKGPDGVVPADGTVEGWRYASADEKPRPPRPKGDFERICRDAPAETGKKRVAIIVDSGIADDALAGDERVDPYGTCVVTDPKSTGAQVLAAIGPVRIEKGLTCGIKGYPSKGCGVAVKGFKLDPMGDPPSLLTIMDPVGSSAPPVADPGDQNRPGDENDPSAKDGTNWTPYIVIAVLLAGLAAGGVLLARRRRT